MSDMNDNHNKEVFISLEPHYEQRVQEILANGHEIFEAPVSQEEMFIKLVQQVSHKVYQKDEDGKGDSASKEQELNQGAQQAPWVKCISHLVAARTEMQQLINLLDLIKLNHVSLTKLIRPPLPPPEQSNLLILRLARKCEAYSQAQQKLKNFQEFLSESIQNSRQFFNVVLRIQSKWRLYVQSIVIPKTPTLKKLMVDFSWKSCGSLFHDSIGAEIMLPIVDKSEKERKMNGKDKKGKEKMSIDDELFIESDEKEKEKEGVSLSLIFPDTLKYISCKISITSNTPLHKTQHSTNLTLSSHTNISPLARQNITDAQNTNIIEALELAQSGRFAAEIFSQMTKEATQGVLPLVQVSEKCIKVDCEDEQVLVFNLESNIDTPKANDAEKDKEEEDVRVENPTLSVLEVMMHRLLLQQCKNNLQQKIVVAPKASTQATAASASTSLKHKLEDENTNNGILPKVVELHKHQQLRTDVMIALEDFAVIHPVRIQWSPTPQVFISSCLVYRTDQSSLKYYKNHVNVVINHGEINCESVGNKMIAYNPKELIEYLKSMLEID
eukprot:TRINITY_DN5780_c0_g1_i1.p1 TRINITY_DN5780_c0_g1~~TRINITY_DN5780_c0_g1_i1.p1  ORF type:complete len:555 (+),score=127.88 TRINITY_DN5780_c0_g1_i1:273-1937(+)